jgi:hypothetical protein
MSTSQQFSDDLKLDGRERRKADGAIQITYDK